MTVNELTNGFYQGKYDTVLSEIGRNPLDVAKTDFETITSFQVGSLVFLGEFHEARVLFERALKLSGPKIYFVFRCRFFLGIGCVRRSDYAGAVRYFAQNVLERKKISKGNFDSFGELSFYTFQGSAFFRFFRGQFEKTRTLAEQAYTAALESDFKYGQVLALDLLGHSHCQLGSVRKGIYDLERALSQAKKLGNGGIATALTVSLAKFRAEFGLDSLQSVKNLNEAIASLSPQDTYSRAELYLELIRQFLIRGKGKEAQLLLEKTGNLIYQHQNKRQSAIFNLRCAHLLLLRGESHAALALASSLRFNLDARIDILISRQADGLIEKIRSQMNKGLSQDFGEVRFVNLIDSRIRSRVSNVKSRSVNLGEDPLGDLLDRVQVRGIEAFYEIKKLGFNGLMPQALQLPIGSTAIYLGPSRGELVIINGGDVTCIERGVTSPIKKLVLVLSGGGIKTKDFLVNQVWNYQYDPSMHDNLLHATIGKLRKLLGEQASWVEWSNDGYKLNEHVSVFFENKTEVHFAKDGKAIAGEDVVEIVSDLPNNRNPRVGLNIRQIKLVNLLKPDEFISVRQYAKRYRICHMTACRDLTALLNLRRVVRVGKGRATAYCLPEGVL